ncbi:uncharacterized protein FYW23_011198 isoform 2-T2 [Sylvia borin]
MPVSRTGSSHRYPGGIGPLGSVGAAVPTGHAVTTATGGRTARGPFKGAGGSRRAAPHGAAARGSHVGGTWRPPIGPPALARCNQLLLGRRAGNGFKGAPQGRRCPLKLSGGRGPFKEVVQSSRGAAKSSGSAEFSRPRPPRPPIGARGERSLLIGRGLRATSRNRGCVTSPGTVRRRPRAGGGGRAMPATAPRPTRGPRKGRGPSEPPCPRRPFTRLKMPTHSTRGMPGARRRTTTPGMSRGGVAPSVPTATAAWPGGSQTHPRRGGRGSAPGSPSYWLSRGSRRVSIGWSGRQSRRGGGRGARRRCRPAIGPGAWSGAWPGGGCVMTPPADPGRSRRAAGGGGGTGHGRGGTGGAAAAAPGQLGLSRAAQEVAGSCPGGTLPALMDARGAAVPPCSWLTSTSSSVASFMSFSSS